MLVANSFDLWQKDAFFSAAEEIQQSADRMESAYRTWLRARRDELIPQHLHEISKELQMALGTAKWQLEEFERAVRLSYINNSDDVTTMRHRQFVSAIQNQISCIETAVKKSVNIEGGKSFRWVNLDEEECDDLALFLLGKPVTSQRNKNEGTKFEESVASSFNQSNAKEDCANGSKISLVMPTANRGKDLEEVPPRIADVNCFTELQESKFSEAGDEISQVDEVFSNCRLHSSSDRNALEIVIDRDDRPTNASIGSTPKEKGFKPFFWRSRGGVRSASNLARMKINNWINRHLRGGHRSQRHQQVSPLFPVKSIRFILAFILTIFFVVPFLLYST